jgi:histidinol-phosphate aminotransferase
VTEPRTTSWIQKIPPYVPGTSKDEAARRYGITNPIKLASNENPLGPSPKALEAMAEHASRMHLYPDPDAADLKKAAAAFFNCLPEQVTAGNGSDEIIDLLCRAHLEPGDEVVIPSCTFSYYRIASLVCGAEITTTAMKGHLIDVDDILQRVSSKTKIVFLANPNNPTGTCLSIEDVARLATGIPGDALLVVDEAYAAFVRQQDFASAVCMINNMPNVAVISTLSKSHGLAGLRVGFCIAGEPVTGAISRIKPPFNMNTLALKAGEAALGDAEFLQKTLKTTWEGLDFLYGQLERLGLEFTPSQTNFVLVKIGDDSDKIYEKLMKKGVITRSMSSFGLRGYLRVSIGLPEENKAFVNALYQVL